MKDTSEVTACVIDHGLFIPIARRLAQDFKKVYYWSPWEKAFPLLQDCMIGDGFPDVDRVDSIWDIKDECNLWVFPDIGFSGLQLELQAQGFPVWGSRKADELEVYRGKFLNALITTNLPVPKYIALKGITALREHLIDQEDKWIKISKYRGMMETLHWRDWEQDEGTLDILAVKFGPMREQITFYVFDNIDTTIEDGCDSYCIDGKWPATVVHGFECKDKGYVGTFQKFEDLPKEVRIVNEEFGPILEGYGYRSFFSTEVRITEEGESFFTDPTCRAGSPPSQVMTEMIGNYGDIIWHGANGELVEPEPAAKFGVQSLVSLKGDPRLWRVTEVPSKIDQWFKCGTCAQVDGNLCFPPDHDGTSNDVGWLVGVGATLEKAINHLKENVEQLPDGLTCEVAPLADLLKEIKTAEETGMEFSDQPIPEPEIVL